MDDVRYLLNKDTLYYSLYTLMTRQEGTEQTMDEGFTWDEGIWWNHMTALDNYERPEPSGEILPPTRIWTRRRTTWRWWNSG